MTLQILFGVLLLLYGLISIYVAWKKPKGLWNSEKHENMRRALGDTGALIQSYTLGIASVVLGAAILAAVSKQLGWW